MTTLAAEGLGIRWPAQEGWALRDCTCTLRAGELAWLHGPLGAGASTLLLALAGLHPRLTGGERAGRVTLDGTDPAAASPLDLGIGYLGPSPALQLSGIARTVRDEVAVGPMNLGWPRERIADAVHAALARTGIAHLADRAPERLSGGETQRLLLAALLATAPRVLLLDEPFSALDRAARDATAQLLRSLARDGLVVAVACDDPDTMRPHADRLLVMHHGRVTLDGPPDPILAGPELAALDAATTDAGALARAAGWTHPVPLDAAALLAATGVTPVAPEESPPHDQEGHAPALAMAGVTFRYPGQAPVLTNASLHLPAGTAAALLGPNGAGKSTILRLAMALEHPERGTVITLDRTTRGLGPEDLAPDAGFLFQQPERQLFASSVRAECDLGPRLAGWDSARREAAVADALDTLGLAPWADWHPWDLPLPLRRLLALAAVLVTAPRLLLLDEPTAALDAASRGRVIGAVRAAQARGATILAVTHDAAFAHEALDRAWIVGGGQVAPAGPVDAALAAAGLAPPAALEVGRALGLRGADTRRDPVARALAGRQRSII